MKERYIRKKLAYARSHVRNPGYGRPTTPARMGDASPAHQARFYRQISHWEMMLDRCLAVKSRRENNRG